MRLMSLLFPLLLTVACDDAPCAATCDRLYGDLADECYLVYLDRSTEELLAGCNSECASAWETSGSLGDYDPNEQSAEPDAFTLENQAQVEAWATCVNGTSCEMIAEGYCAPTKF